MEKTLPRRQARENAFLFAFSTTFHYDTNLEASLLANEEDSEQVVDEFGKRLLHAYNAHEAEVNDLITARLRGWTLARLPRVSVTALRLAIAEMLYTGENKPSVAINEAVELVKKYGAGDDYQFVNGLLGSVARDLNLQESEKPQENS
ncbi:MAG: transcription antitermination factor NusB [Faecalibacterium sp.]